MVTMEKKFLLKGLDCPNCAAKIEKKVSELDGVSNVSLNLMKQSLTLNTEDGDKIDEKIEKIVHSLEPHVKVSELSKNNTHHSEHNHCHEGCHCHGHGHEHINGHEHGHEHDNGKNIPLRLLIGGALYAIGLILSFFPIVPFPVGLILTVISYIILGVDVLMRAVKNIVKGRVFDENFLMSLSTLGAFAIGEYHEAVAVMLFYQIGEFFQSLAVRRSRRSISQLMDIRPDHANLIVDGHTETVSPADVGIGSLILIKPGERIPLDGEIIDGVSSLDVRALTGESAPRDVDVGDKVLSGSVNQGGALTVRVTHSFGESTASKIIDLVENASASKAKTENFITSFARYYTPAVVVIATLLALIPPLAFSGSWTEWLHRAMVFLVISCPCALVISIPLSFFGGIGASSKHGILIKGGNYLEALAKIDRVIFDKTGTLTKGSFSVTELISADGIEPDRLLELAAYGEALSDHPIAQSILNEYSKRGREMERALISDYRNIPGKGVVTIFDGAELVVGNRTLLEEKSVNVPSGITQKATVFVAHGGEYMGHIVLSDEIKEDSRKAIKSLRSMGVSGIFMLTGDSEKVAEGVATELSLDGFRAELLPHEKLEVIKSSYFITKGSGKLAFVGDGINDAPVLAAADVGIAMGGLGSDAAIEAADAVIMTDEPSKLAEAIRIARVTRRIVLQNIVFTLTVKALFLILGAFGIAGMWEAVFGDVGVALLAILNSMRILKK